MVLAAMATSAVAQSGNPNSPRERREMEVLSRIQPPPQTQVGETLEPSRWGTFQNTVGQPAWGTMGTKGWLGIAPQPQK
jgi:hypothetical protein